MPTIPVTPEEEAYFRERELAEAYSEAHSEHGHLGHTLVPERCGGTWYTPEHCARCTALSRQYIPWPCPYVPTPVQTAQEPA